MPNFYDQPQVDTLILGRQPADSDLTALAALTTTSYGRAFLELANQAGLMALVQSASETAQGKVELATQTETNTGTDDARAVTPLKFQTRLAAYAQPLDSDLTAIAALTTTAFGRSLLTAADAAATRALIGAGADRTVTTTTSTATLTPAATSDRNFAAVTAQAAALTVASPTGSPAHGTTLTISIRDNGTARAITWNATYRGLGITLPTTTSPSKTFYVQAVYNTAETLWDVVACTPPV